MDKVTITPLLSDIERTFFEKTEIGDYEAIQLLLTQLVNLDIQHEGKTALYIALENNHFKLAHLLLEQGVNPRIVCNKNIPLQIAVKVALQHAQYETNNESHEIEKVISEESRKTIELLLQKGAQPNRPDQQGHLPLYSAINENCRMLVELLLNYHANPNKPFQGKQSLFYAIEKEAVKIVELLLHHGANAKQNNYLSLTLDKNFVAVVGDLLKHGADPNQTHHAQKSCLEMVVDQYTRTTKLLSQHDENPEGIDPDKESCSAVAVGSHRRKVKLLLADNKNSNWSHSFRKMLLLDSKAQYIKAIEALLNYKAKLNAATEITLLSIAIDTNQLSIATALLEHKHISPNHSYSGKVLLCRAVETENLELIDILMKYGADPAFEYAPQSTPLSYAVEKDRWAIIPTLLLPNLQIRKLNEKTRKALLIYALKERNLELAATLLAKGVRIPFTVDEGKAFLHDEVRIAVSEAHKSAPRDIPTINADSHSMEVIELLLKRKVSPNHPDAQKEPPLYTAVYYECLNLVALLLQYGANPNQPAPKHKTILHYAIEEYSHIEIVKLLLPQNIAFQQGQELLHLAIRCDFLKTVKLLLTKLPTAYQHTEWKTLIEIAVRHNREEIIEFLFESKNTPILSNSDLRELVEIALEKSTIAILAWLLARVSYNPQSSDWKTLLQVAVGVIADTMKRTNFLTVDHKDKKMLELLLQYKADPNQQDEQGETPLYVAVKSRYLDLIKFLLEHGGDPNQTIFSDKRLLQVLVKSIAETMKREAHLLVSHEDEKMLELLLQYKADPNQQDEQGETPLYVAVKGRCLDLIKFLLEHGGDPNQTIFSDKRLLQVLVKSIAETMKREALFLMSNEDKKVLELLLKHKVGPSQADEQGETLLYIPVKYHVKDLVENLLANGEDPNIWTEQTGTLLYIAIKSFFRNNIKLRIELQKAQGATNSVGGDTIKHLGFLVGCDQGIVEALLNHHADPNQKRATDKPPLLIAIEGMESDQRNNVLVKLVELFLVKGADPSLNFGEKTVLYIAVQKKYWEAAKLLLKHSLRSSVEPNAGQEALLVALAHQDFESAKWLLEQTVNPNHTSLLYAVKNSTWEIAWLLLRQVIINRQDNKIDKSTQKKILTRTAKDGTLTNLKMLVVPPLNWDIHAYDLKKETTPMQAAMQQKDEQVEFEILDYLLLSETNFDLQLTHNEQKQLFIFAARYGQQNIIGLLLQHNKLLLDAQDDTQETALHAAARRGKIHTIRFLLASNIKVNEKNQDGDTPLLIAAQHEDMSIIYHMVQLLLEKGAIIQAQNNNKDTVLHIVLKPQGSKPAACFSLYEIQEASNAMETNRIKIVELLLEHRAAINIENANGKTPKQLAEEGNYEDILTMFEKYTHADATQEHKAVNP